MNKIVVSHMESSHADDYVRELIQCYPRILRFFLRAIPHEAEDLAGDVVLAALRAGKGFRGEASIGTLTFRIAVRVLARRRRQLRRAGATEAHGELLDTSPDEWMITPQDDELQAAPSAALAVRVAMAKLDPELARVIELSYIEGKTQRETSEILGLAQGTVASRLRRAKKHLRAELSQVLGAASAE